VTVRNLQRTRLNKLRKAALVREAVDRGIPVTTSMTRGDLIGMLADRLTFLEGPVPVKVTVFWGRRWNGSWYETTQGQGAHYEVLARQSIQFDGCPLGSGSTEEIALADFVTRSTSEFRGEGSLTVSRLNVVQRRDYREVV
jgi:hypothetical protein